MDVTKLLIAGVLSLSGVALILPWLFAHRRVVVSYKTTKKF